MVGGCLYIRNFCATLTFDMILHTFNEYKIGQLYRTSAKHVFHLHSSWATAGKFIYSCCNINRKVTMNAREVRIIAECSFIIKNQPRLSPLKDFFVEQLQVTVIVQDQRRLEEINHALRECGLKNAIILEWSVCTVVWIDLLAFFCVIHVPSKGS